MSLVKGTDQRPQLTGERADRPILGGGLPARPAVLVTEVRGDSVTLNAGRLVGVAPGSLYAAGEAADAAQVRILESRDTASSGRIESGALRVGDFLSERERAYASDPLRVCALSAQDGRDQLLVESLRARVQRLPGFVWTDSQGESDLLLAVLRPKRVDGKPEFAQTPKGRDTLPVLDPAAIPEVWVLNRGEHLLNEYLAVPLPPTGEGAETLAHDLERYRRATELRRLTAEAAGKTGIDLALLSIDTYAGPAPECFELPGTHAWYRRVPRTGSIADLKGHTWPEGTLLSFTLENIGLHERYAYLLELSPDGAIKSVFPHEGSSAETALLRPGQRLDLFKENVGLLLDAPGEVSLLVLTTQWPIDPRFLTQAGYQRSGAASGARGAGPNPLERLLADTIQGSGTPSRGKVATGTWGGTLYDYRVERRGATPAKAP